MKHILLALLLTLPLACSSSEEDPTNSSTSMTANGDLGGQPADMASTAANDLGQTQLDMATVKPDMSTAQPLKLRVASFNVSLYRDSQGGLLQDLESGTNAQAQQIAQVLQIMQPDIVLLNEFDWDDQGKAAQAFVSKYLASPQGGNTPLDYPHIYVPPTNTGIHSGIDLNKDGRLELTPGSRDYGNDSLGFGTFPGQYGMIVLSKYPIQNDGIRTFQKLLWKQMPQSLLPSDWYTPEAVELLRLSSKIHADVPITIAPGKQLHLLISHPTPAGFDGPEDRNGRRNHDEIRFWNDYLTNDASSWITDDQGKSQGLANDALFAILGDLNSDPVDGGSRTEAINNLLTHPRVQDPQPSSEGASQKSAKDGDANDQHQGDAKFDTADFSDGRVGNLRVDYALPSKNMTLKDSGVFWPTSEDPNAPLSSASDHHLVWFDVEVAP